MGETAPNGSQRLLTSIHEDKNREEVPLWVQILHKTVYFNTCATHTDTKKNELDRFCIDCLRCLCYHCLPQHAHHRHVKIRRYVYCEVINRQDLRKLFNCSGIQSYYTNKTRVLFLKRRPQTQAQPPQQQNTRCIICSRNLQDASSFYCSIACKVAAIYKTEQREEVIQDRNRISIRNEEECLDNDDVVTVEGYVSPIEKRKRDKEVDISLLCRKRQKLRKGIAMRSPLF